MNNRFSCLFFLEAFLLFVNSSIQFHIRRQLFLSFSSVTLSLQCFITLIDLFFYLKLRSSFYVFHSHQVLQEEVRSIPRFSLIWDRHKFPHIFHRDELFDDAQVEKPNQHDALWDACWRKINSDCRSCLIPLNNWNEFQNIFVLECDGWGFLENSLNWLIILFKE